MNTTAQLKLELPTEEHRRFKLYALEHETTMTTVMRTIVTAVLDNDITPEDIRNLGAVVATQKETERQEKHNQELEKQAKLTKDVLEHYNDDTMPPQRRGNAVAIYKDFAKEFGIDHLPIPDEILNFTKET